MSVSVGALDWNGETPSTTMSERCADLYTLAVASAKAENIRAPFGQRTSKQSRFVPG